MFRRSTSRTDTAAAPPEVDVATVTEATFLQDTAGEVALIDFWAPWCAPCRAFAPIFHDVAAQRSGTGFRFGSCNVDDNPETAALLGIRTIPTVVAFDAAGNELARIVGVPSRQDLEALVDKAQAAR
ncbi:MAG TPA: thioredoxin domain-containing protein [Acidimicrobiales bacterium]|nr:thioredoxin domain-containing protein [Acidimicrobiales bacterium]